ncbi:MAG: hypothetical protein LUQ25_06845 [Methanoregulaceae archaeon]|nr:hypothetical protein [Methanoregulaceae archaeon]
MERRDLIMVGLGLAIVMVMAFIVKPVVTGKPVEIGVPLPFLPTPTPSPTPFLRPDTSVGSSTPYPTKVTTPAPTPWNGSERRVGVIAGDAGSQPRRSVMESENLTNPTEPAKLVTYANISGNRSGRTESFSIPFPYWEISYTLRPDPDRYIANLSQPTMGGYSGATAAERMPKLSIKVIDAAHPDQVIRTIEPPGGIDPELWKRNASKYDPRPWSEKFYETGSGKTYYFSISAQGILDYTIEVKVPASYIGRF